jgi:hypothetical protein
MPFPPLDRSFRNLPPPTPASVGAALRRGSSWEGIAAAHNMRSGGRGLRAWAKRTWRKAHPLPAEPPDVFALMAEPTQGERERIVRANMDYYHQVRHFSGVTVTEIEAWLIAQAKEGQDD